MALQFLSVPLRLLSTSIQANLPTHLPGEPRTKPCGLSSCRILLEPLNPSARFKLLLAISAETD